MQILETMSGQGHNDPRMVYDTSAFQDASTPNLGSLPQRIQEICIGHIEGQADGMD